MLTLADVGRLEALVALAQRHLTLIDEGLALLATGWRLSDVAQYPQLHAAENRRLVALLELSVAPRPTVPTDDAAQALARQLEQSTVLLTIWAERFLPLLLRHTAPAHRPPLQRLRDETFALLAETAAVRATQEAPNG